MQNTSVFNVFYPPSIGVHEPLQNGLELAFWCILAAGFSHLAKSTFFRVHRRARERDMPIPVVPAGGMGSLSLSQNFCDGDKDPMPPAGCSAAECAKHISF